MSLLYWADLVATANDGLAAIRFTAPIQISAIRIFPNGAKPFANAPDVVAHTQPESFFLEVFFNAHPTTTVVDPKDKPRVANALVPTVIAYPGGQVNFPVNMGPEYSTRLMIVKGNFSVCSLAIYGEVLNDVPPPAYTHESRPLPSIVAPLLAQPFNPAQSNDPTSLARQLLTLIPNAPPLRLILRLVFCLKSSLDDWNLSDLPSLYANFDTKSEESDLASMIQAVSRPVSDDTPEDVLDAFAARVSDFVKSGDHACHVAHLLSISACQHPGLARALLRHLDLWTIFNEQTLDENTLLFLLDAATNVDIARHLNNDEFLQTLNGLQTSFKIDKSIQIVTRRLSSRIRQWSYFEDALLNTQGDFAQSMEMVKDVSTEERALGIWLESMITHADMVTKLGDNAVFPTQTLPELRFQGSLNISSQHDFIAFIRALIGVASVLAVLAWTDELGNDVCRERVLGILDLWQGVDGYRELVNHMLLLRQLTRRLKWIISDSIEPRKSGMLSERVLSNLAKEPHAILQQEVVDAILSLRQPLTFITEDELRELQKIAYVSEDGLPAAVDELVFTSDHPLSYRRLRVLRVALTIILREMEGPDCEWQLLQAFEDSEAQPQGIMSSLVDILTGISSDLNAYFAISPSLRMNQTLTEQLFRTADDTLRLLNHLLSIFPLNSRSMRQLTIAVADVFACADLADIRFSHTRGACMAAQEAVQSCLYLMRALAGPKSVVEPGRLGADIVLRTLLQHATNGQGKDPANHLLRVFTIIDHILPEQASVPEDGDSSDWVTSLLPNALEDIKTTFRSFDPENKLYFLKRLVNIDDGVIEVGEWVLIEELKYLLHILRTLSGSSYSPEYQLMLQYEISLSIRFFLDLTSNSALSSWCIGAVSKVPDLSAILSACLLAIVGEHYTSHSFLLLVSELVRSSKSFNLELSFAVVVAGLYVLRREESESQLFHDIVGILDDLPVTEVDTELLRLELGRTLMVYADRKLDQAASEGLLSVLCWLSSQSTANFTTLLAITSEHFAALGQSILCSIPESETDLFKQIQSQLKTDDDGIERSSSSLGTNLPESLTLPLPAVRDLLEPELSTPSTPRGTKTPDVLGVIISPPTALLRSNGVCTTGLTKTYLNNDFRQLRQAPSARQNTSRLPSLHVDDFQETAAASTDAMDIEALAFPAMLEF